MSEEILFLTHRSNEDVLSAIRKTFVESGGRPVTVLSQDAGFRVPGTETVVFSENEVMKQCGYPVIGDRIVPGHAHMPVFSYILSREASGTAYYWVMEYDVRFTGRWHGLFNAFSQDNSDLITCHVRRYDDEPGWAWWDLSHPKKEIAHSDRIRSFNPFYRISAKAVRFLHRELKSGWKGHSELILATLLDKNGYLVSDFGGHGEFAVRKNRFYTCYSDSSGKLRSGTFRHKPAMRSEGFLSNKLYHPVKAENAIGPIRSGMGSLWRRLRLK
jgi:hypothetical protein